MRREEAEQTPTRNRRIISAARRLHRALVVGQAAPEDFYAAEAIFVKTVENQMYNIAQTLQVYAKARTTSSLAKRAATESRLVLRKLAFGGLRTGFGVAVDQDGYVHQRVLEALLDIDQEIGSKLVLLSQIMKQLRRRRSHGSVGYSIKEALGVLSGLKEALTRRCRLSAS